MARRKSSVSGKGEGVSLTPIGQAIHDVKEKLQKARDRATDEGKKAIDLDIEILDEQYQKIKALCGPLDWNVPTFGIPPKGKK